MNSIFKTLMVSSLFFMWACDSSSMPDFLSKKSKEQETKSDTSQNLQKVAKVEEKPEINQNIYLNSGYEALEPHKAFLELNEKINSQKARLQDYIDCATSLMFMKQHEKANELLEKALDKTSNEKEKAVVYAQQALAMSLWAKEYPNDKTRYRVPLNKAKKAIYNDPENDYYASMVYGYAALCGDRLEQTVADINLKQKVPDAAGKEVMDPVTGTVIIVMTLCATVITLHANSDAEGKKIINEQLPHIIAAIANLPTSKFSKFKKLGSEF